MNEYTIVNNNGGSYHHRILTYPNRYSGEDRVRYCPICNEPFMVGEDIYGFIQGHNARFGFILHKKCSGKTLEDTVEMVMQIYDKYIDNLDAHKYWSTDIHRTKDFIRDIKDQEQVYLYE